MRHIPEESNVHSHHHDDLKPHIGTIFAYVGIGHMYIYLAIWHRADHIKKNKLEKIFASFKRRFMPGGKQHFCK
jgi:hypothetical protein